MPRVLTGALLPVLGLLVGLLAGWSARRIVIPRLKAWAARTTTSLDDVLVADLRPLLPLWGALVGVHIGLGLAELSPAALQTARHLVVAVLGLSITWGATRLVGAAFRASSELSRTLPAARILSNVTQALVAVLGVLVTLSSIGVSVTPVLTALGVGGLAVGLALQDTLANLFAGFHLLVSRQVRPGDFIRLSSGQEGYVADITWRYTTIRQLSNDVIIVPNAELASAVTANFSLPDPEQAVLVEVGVSYDADLEHVERVVTAVGTDVQATVTGGVSTFAPFIRFHTFGDSSINFTVILRGVQYTDRYLLKHEFIKRLHRRFREEAITIPYPQRTLYIERGGAAA